MYNYKVYPARDAIKKVTEDTMPIKLNNTLLKVNLPKLFFFFLNTLTTKLMAEDNNQLDKSGPSEFTNLLIGALTALLLTGGLAAALGERLKSWLIEKNSYYTCTFIIKNGQNNISNTKTDFSNDTSRTDDSGVVVYKALKGIYKLKFVYGNKPHTKFYRIIKDTTCTFDISSSLSNPLTGEAVKSALIQPNKFINQRVVSAPKAIKITATEKPQPSLSAKVPVDAPEEASSKDPVVLKPLSANEVLQQLKLKVRIDMNDAYNFHNKQFAYHYRLEGSQELLEQVIQVLYQRNDPSFPEVKNNQFYTSTNRNSGFEYAGYQWGSVSTTYVQIVLSNNTKSDIFLKSIIYE